MKIKGWDWLRWLWSGDIDGSFYPATLNEGRNYDAWVWSSLITRYLKFTAQSERELSVHPCCLHSFSSERWTWTSSDRTQVNVYLSPFLSSWEFVLRPDRKPLASPLRPVTTLSEREAKPQENTRHSWRLLGSRRSGLMGSTCGRTRLVNCKGWVFCCQLLTSVWKVNPNPKWNQHVSYLSLGPLRSPSVLFPFSFSFQSRCSHSKGETHLRTKSTCVLFPFRSFVFPLMFKRRRDIWMFPEA